MSIRANTLLFGLLLIFWLVLCVAGLSILFAYEHRAAGTIIGPPVWPSDLSLKRASGYTLILSIHPQCPCTQAT
ncbi:MAG: hypothetical protein ACRD3W_31275, partial [Terriglobales bacterium]